MCSHFDIFCILFASENGIDHYKFGLTLHKFIDLMSFPPEQISLTVYAREYIFPVSQLIFATPPIILPPVFYT